ncbi:MAG TPA: patatin-like phospholipase family protein [Candidatus Binatia bacterium]|nr:patatin-like phospholipase family protein [Candidatus Binatia bacterium]
MAKTLCDGVFEGGGAKGAAFVGALEAMERHDLWFQRVAGTSAGSIVAALIAAGYPAASGSGETIKDLLFTTPFENFKDAPDQDAFSEAVRKQSYLYQLLQDIHIPGFPLRWEEAIDQHIFQGLNRSQFFRFIFNLIECGGLYAGAYFRQWINDKVTARLRGKGAVDEYPTFAQMFAITGISLSVVASDTTKQQFLVFNEQLTPAVKVADAVRMSMSIPFFFSSVSYQGSEVVDGGLLSNFPMFLFLTQNPFLTNTQAELNRLTIGFLLDETQGNPPVEARHEGKEEKLLVGEITGLKTVKRILNLVDTMMAAHDKKDIEHKEDVVRIGVKGYQTTQFELSEAQRKDLASRGWEATVPFLQQKGVIANPQPSPYP